MPKPFKLFSARPRPPDADLIDYEGTLHVRLRDGRNRVILCRLSKDGRSYLRPSKCWYFDLRDLHRVRRVKGFTDLKATEQLAAEMERKVARARAGLIDSAEEHVRRPLLDHLKDYAAYLKAKGDTAAYVRQTVGRVTALLSGCGFVFPLDADASKAADWLNNLRYDGTPVELPAADEFTPAEAAKLLGVSGAAVRAAVKRLKLPAAGNGRARRFPRSTVEALALNQAKGCGPETVNHYVRAVRGFFRWLVKAKRLGSYPLESLAFVNTAGDFRRMRRELTVDELLRLFSAARASTRTFRGLTATDRYFLYLVAASTGFRASALANLTPKDFDLTSPLPVVTLPARFAKNRKTKVQPLPADVAAAIAPYLAQKAPGKPIWGGTWAQVIEARKCFVTTCSPPESPTW